MRDRRSDPDRKTVMSWLEGLAQDDWREWHSDSEVQTTAQAALELLKEQEAVEPKSKVRHGANAQIQHFCGNCMTLLHGKPKYCSECGKKVYWRDRQ